MSIKHNFRIYKGKHLILVTTWHRCWSLLLSRSSCGPLWFHTWKISNFKRSQQKRLVAFNYFDGIFWVIFRMQQNTGWWFQIFCCVHPYLGEIPTLTNIFQRGWNHQLGDVCSLGVEFLTGRMFAACICFFHDFSRWPGTLSPVENYPKWEETTIGRLSILNFHDNVTIWSNHSDLTRPHPKWWFRKGDPLISKKPRLVKCYNLARWLWEERYVNSGVFGFHPRFQERAAMGIPPTPPDHEEF